MQSSTLGTLPILTLKSYLKGRDLTHSSECSDTIIKNAEALILKVNALLDEIKITRVYVNSGWRPAAINEQIGGSKHSYHLLGKAVDLADPLRVITDAILDKPELLRIHGLWMEDPKHAKTWVHLDDGDRPDRPIRIFQP